MDAHSIAMSLFVKANIYVAVFGLAKFQELKSQAHAPQARSSRHPGPDAPLLAALAEQDQTDARAPSRPP
jgi:hypothetical protein